MMPEKPQKLKFPKCEGYGVETLDYGNVSGTHYISFSDQVEKALSKAEQEGAKAERERILEAIRIVCGEFDDEEAYAIEERLKAELEGRK